MWIEDTQGNLHNAEHLVSIYLHFNSASRVWFLKGRDINDTDIIFGTYACAIDANAARVLLGDQLTRRKHAKAKA